MEHIFSKKSNEDDLNVLLDNIFAVCNDEMGWSCEKPSDSECSQQTTGNADIDYIRKTIDEMKDSLEVLYNNIQGNASEDLDINNDIISLLSIQGEIDDLNRKVIDFKNSIHTFTASNAAGCDQNIGNIQAMNDIISIL